MPILNPFFVFTRKMVMANKLPLGMKAIDTLRRVWKTLDETEERTRAMDEEIPAAKWPASSITT
jgi:hypothetical protein